MAAKEIVVKKYVVRLSCGERSLLETLIRKGSNPAQRLLKARILLKADVSEAGEGWSDNQIIQALATSASMVYRVRKQLVEEGFEAVLSRKQRATPAVARIFDGEKEAKLIALACSKPPKGRARWTGAPHLHMFGMPRRRAALCIHQTRPRRRQPIPEQAAPSVVPALTVHEEHIAAPDLLIRPIDLAENVSVEPTQTEPVEPTIQNRDPEPVLQHAARPALSASTALDKHVVASGLLSNAQ